MKTVSCLAKNSTIDDLQTAAKRKGKNIQDFKLMALNGMTIKIKMSNIISAKIFTIMNKCFIAIKFWLQDVIN